MAGKKGSVKIINVGEDKKAKDDFDEFLDDESVLSEVESTNSEVIEVEKEEYEGGEDKDKDEDEEDEDDEDDEEDEDDDEEDEDDEDEDDEEDEDEEEEDEDDDEEEDKQTGGAKGKKLKKSPSTDSMNTVEMLSSDPLYIVMSQFFKSSSGSNKNVVDVLEDLNTILTDIKKMMENLTDKF